MILRITEADVSGPHALRLAFNDGTRKTVDVGPLLNGPVMVRFTSPTFLLLGWLLLGSLAERPGRSTFSSVSRPDPTTSRASAIRPPKKP
jgi:hypothetical protein